MKLSKLRCKVMRTGQGTRKDPSTHRLAVLGNSVFGPEMQGQQKQYFNVIFMTVTANCVNLS